MSGQDNLNLDEGKLVVSSDLGAGREDELRSLCGELLNSSRRELTIDLSEVKYIHSLSVGMLSYAWVEALSRDKEIAFTVSQEVADIFERTGLSKVFSYEVITGDKESEESEQSEENEGD